ncbi:MAG: dihydrolipoyl dehydrogenase [Pseudonocardiales bacterium]|nr:MAG: dihydrolipoyl dehydrogenase [Pseudonocardiales bacterium]
MVVGEIAEAADFIVIGGGPGGYMAALRAAQLGADVLLVERGGPPYLGGTCLHVGCIPSKSLIELSRLCQSARTSAHRGLVADLVVDLAAFQQHRDDVVKRLCRGISALLRRRRVRVITGEAFFNRPDRIAVRHDNQVSFFDFHRAVIATGSRARQSDVLPVDGTRTLDSSGALALTSLPPRLSVVGGDYIGMEIATAFAALGSVVTVLHDGTPLFPGIDADLLSPVHRRLERLGVTVLPDSTVCGRDDDVLHARTPKGAVEVGTDVTVVSLGRQPNTDEIGLHLADVAVDTDGFISTDTQCLVRPGLAAVGDVTQGPALAHKAYAQALVAAESLCGRPASFQPYAIPVAIFTDPEIASVGMTAEQARDAGAGIQVVNFPLSALGRAATVNASDGFCRLVVDQEQDRILGAQIVAPQASDLIAEVGLAIEMAASPHDLAATVHAHPTMSEGLYEAASLAAGVPLHVP